MAESLNDWLHQHAGLALPILRHSRDFFQSQQDIPSVSISRLWGVTAKDPGLCLNLLKLAGKSRKTRVISVQHAMRMLGMPRVLALPGELPALDESLDPETRQRVLAVHARAFHTSQQCLDWSRGLHDNTVEDTATAGIVSNLAEYLLYCYTPQQAGQIAELVSSEDTAPDTACREVMGFTLQALSWQVAQAWSLPELVCRSFTATAESCQKSQLTALARSLCREAERDWNSDSVHELSGQVARLLSKPQGVITASMHRLAVRCAREYYRHHDTVLRAATNLVQLPHAEIPEKRIPDAAARARSLQQTLWQLQHSDHDNSAAIFSLTFKALTRALGLSRVFFAVMDKNRKTLVIKLSAGYPHLAATNPRRLPLDDNRLLRLMLNKPQLLWVNARNRAKYLPLLSGQLRARYVRDEFFMASLYIGDKPIGLIYSDRNGDSPLDEQSFRLFKKVCHDTAGALANRHAKNGQAHTIHA